MQHPARQSAHPPLAVMLSHLRRLRVREIETGTGTRVLSTREGKEGVNAEVVMSPTLQDQRNVQAFSPLFIHTRGRIAVQKGSPVWEGELVHGRGLLIWEDNQSAGTAGEEQRQESFVG